MKAGHQGEEQPKHFVHMSQTCLISPSPCIFQPGEHKSGQSQQGMGTALCLSCTATSPGPPHLTSSWGVQRGPQCAMVWRVLLSAHPWDGAAGACRSPGPTAIQRAAGIWEGQSVTRSFYGQDLRLSRQWQFS